MEFDPNFLGTFPYFSEHFLENPCIKPEIPTMVNPLQGSSTLAPPPPLSDNNNNNNNNNNSSSLLLHHNYNFHHFPLNLNYHHGNFVMEGGPSSSSIKLHHQPFFSSSSMGDHFEAATAYATNSESLIRDFVTPNYMAFTPANNNNKMVMSDALHGYDNGLQVVGPTLSPSSPLVYDHNLVPMNHNNKLNLQDEISSIAHGSNSQQRAEVGAMMRRQQKRMLRKQSRCNVQHKISNTIKGQWTPEEDRLLLQLVECYGLKKWSKIAKFLNGRVGKQCRERWHDHLRPNIRKESWTEEEDRVLIEAHQEIGNKWAEIAQKLPGRTENTIKNRWNATKRRLNSKKQKNKLTTSKGTLLMNYIKQVYKAEATTKLKNCMSKMKIMSTQDCINNDHRQGLLQVQYESLEGGFDSQDWATTIKEDGWSLERHVFPRKGGGYVPKLGINTDDVATKLGFVVDDSTNMNYEVAMEMENLGKGGSNEEGDGPNGDDM